MYVEVMCYITYLKTRGNITKTHKEVAIWLQRYIFKWCWHFSFNPRSLGFIYINKERKTSFSENRVGSCEVNHSYLSEAFSCNFWALQESDKKNPKTKEKVFLLFLIPFFDAYKQHKINLAFCTGQQILSRISIFKTRFPSWIKYGT